MKSGESLQDMITRFTTVVNKLISLGKVYTTEEQVDKVLRILPRSWEIKVTAIREAKDLTTMSLDELVGNLKTYEMNVDKRSEGNKEKVLGLKATKSDESDIDDDDLALINRSSNKGLPSVELEWKKEKAEKERKELLNKRKTKEKEQEMYAAWGTGSSDMYEDVEDLALMAIEESDAEPESDSEETEEEVRESKQQWYMDSACSRHMTRNKTLFLSLEEGKGGMVAFGGGKKGQIKGCGKIGRTDEHSIDKVYYVEGLRHNLLSISQLCDKDNKVIFLSTGVEVINLNTQKLVLTGK
ncbi:uncharacterized protein [Solanum lycopersicum]|uniref:uncharacterized protein n=1 Tax=Solanum lycopersicum TaxID=4081 RepID=UPI0037495476